MYVSGSQSNIKCPASKELALQNADDNSKDNGTMKTKAITEGDEKAPQQMHMSMGT